MSPAEKPSGGSLPVPGCIFYIIGQIRKLVVGKRPERSFIGGESRQPTGIYPWADHTRLNRARRFKSGFSNQLHHGVVVVSIRVDEVFDRNAKRDPPAFSCCRRSRSLPRRWEWLRAADGLRCELQSQSRVRATPGPGFDPSAAPASYLRRGPTRCAGQTDPLRETGWPQSQALSALEPREGACLHSRHRMKSQSGYRSRSWSERRCSARSIERFCV